MNTQKLKRGAFDLVLWITFGFCAYSAGARLSVNPIAMISMYLIVVVMLMREWRQGVDEGSEIASSVWKAKMDELFEMLRNG